MSSTWYRTEATTESSLSAGVSLRWMLTPQFDGYDVSEGFMRPVVGFAADSPGFAPCIGPKDNHASPDSGWHCKALARGAPDASLNHSVSPLFISAGAQVCLVKRLRRIDTVGCWPGARMAADPEAVYA